MTQECKSSVKPAVKDKEEYKNHLRRIFLGKINDLYNLI